jgi:hypothetical protein
MDTKKRKPHLIELAGEEVRVDFSLASLFYLTEKHADLPKFLELVSGAGKTGAEKLTPEFIKAVAELIYSGLIQPDDEGNDLSGWSVPKVMRSIHPMDMGAISSEVLAAWTDGGQKNPPPAAKS